MPGVAPRGSVWRELILQIRNLRGAKPDEDRQSHPSGDGERLLARGRHAKRRMRELIGSRRDRGILDRLEPAVVAERLSRPRVSKDLERLAKAGLALGIRDAVGVVRAHDAASADPELEPAFADLVDGRDLLGDAQRMIERKHL